MVPLPKALYRKGWFLYTCNHYNSDVFACENIRFWDFFIAVCLMIWNMLTDQAPGIVSQDTKPSKAEEHKKYLQELGEFNLLCFPCFSFRHTFLLFLELISVNVSVAALHTFFHCKTLGFILLSFSYLRHDCLYLIKREGSFTQPTVQSLDFRSQAFLFFTRPIEVWVFIWTAVCKSIHLESNIFTITM